MPAFTSQAINGHVGHQLQPLYGFRGVFKDLQHLGGQVLELLRHRPQLAVIEQDGGVDVGVHHPGRQKTRGVGQQALIAQVLGHAVAQVADGEPEDAEVGVLVQFIQRAEELVLGDQAGVLGVGPQREPLHLISHSASRVRTT